MSEPRSDINQLPMQVKYNLQVLWRLVDLVDDSNVNIAIQFKHNSSKQICRRWFCQQSSLVLGKSPVFFWRPSILKYIVWSKREWRRIRARSDPESLISESDLESLISEELHHHL